MLTASSGSSSPWCSCAAASASSASCCGCGDQRALHRRRGRPGGPARDERRVRLRQGAVERVDSLTASDYAASVVDRLGEWPVHTLTVMPFIVIVWLGAWAARHRILEDPARHRRLLVATAVGD
ncbi:hypothetical protein NKH77_45315 [Streptomyces sp. M19]